MTATVSSAPMTDCSLWFGQPYEPGRRGKAERFCPAPSGIAAPRCVQPTLEAAPRSNRRM